FVEIEGTTYTITGLDRNTHYYVYMRGTCDGDDAPEWKLVAETTTLGLGMDCSRVVDVCSNGASRNSNMDVIPIYSQVADMTIKSQMIYPSTELNLNACKINGMKFYPHASNANAWDNAVFEISLGTTESTTTFSYDFVDAENVTVVYNGTISATQDNMSIDFQTPFDYNGTDNLWIQFRTITPGTNGTQIYYTSIDAEGSGYMEYEGTNPYTGMQFSQYAQSNYLPKVTFTTCKEVKACPEVTKLKANYISYKNATILWNASDGDFLTEYEFAWDDEEIIDFSQVPQDQKLNILKNENETIEVLLNNLTPSTKYYVYVRALCPNDPDEQQSNWSTIEFTTAGFNCDAPTGEVKLNDMNPEQSIIVNWTPNAWQVELYYTTEAGFEPTKETEANENVTSSDIELGFHAITGLTVNTTYYVWARAVCDLGMDNDGKSGWTLMGSATTEADKKFIIFENVGYTISGIHQGAVTIINATYNEDDLTPVDYDITYAENEDEEPGVTDYFNYKYVINVPEKFIDIEQNNTEYEVIAIAANAFDNSIEKYNNIRVNIPLNIVVEGMSVDENVIISLADENRIINNDNTYYASKAYKVNLCDGAEIVQRPFGEQTLKISCPDGEEEQLEDHVFTKQTGAKLVVVAGWNEIPGTSSNELEAELTGDNATVNVHRLNSIRIEKDAEISALGLTDCENLTFEINAIDRKYPESNFSEGISLEGTKVNVEMTLNNKEYYYFSLPFNCNISDIKVVDGDGTVLQRSNSVAEAASDADTEHRYVLLTWNESQYDGTTSGYVALGGDAQTLEANKGYAILIMESYESWQADNNVTVDATATFTSYNYSAITPNSMPVNITTTRANFESTNAFSGWNLVGNPYYNTIYSGWYSYNNYVRQIEYDYGETASVLDYSGEIPVLSAEVRPFQTLFVQQDDGAGEKQMTIGNPENQNAQQAPAVLPEYITITLNDNDRMMDRTTIINKTMASDGYIQNEDLVKGNMSNNEIYTSYYGVNFSFNKMNIEEGKKVVPVGVKVAETGDYTIALSEELTNYGIGNIVLHDKALNTYTTLSEGEKETIHLEKGRTDGRLELIITVNETITGGEDIDDNSNVEIFVNNGIATINGVEAGATIMITDATGKTIYTTEATGDRIDYDFAVRGVYMITVRGEKVSTVKVVY
ncbi:MAG: hypothetical protein MJZ93_01610, partial [Paludibacteraceae bacterium]|nr:hypothetical protein [Paludibacteraceae bacterium]